MQFLPPIYDALSSPVWGSISVISAIILTVITGIQLRLKEKKAISYSIITDTPVIRVKEDVEKDVRILFKDKQVKNVRLVELKIWNSGNVPIEEKHYKRPISFLPGSVKHEGKLLHIKVIEKDPPDLPVEKPRLYIEEDVIGLPNMLLHKKDSVTIKILLADYDEKITVGGRILGVSRIEEEIITKVPIADTLKTITFSFLVGFLVVIITYVVLEMMHMRDQIYLVLAIYLGLIITFYFISPLIEKMIEKNIHRFLEPIPQSPSQLRE